MHKLLILLAALVSTCHAREAQAPGHKELAESSTHIFIGRFIESVNNDDEFTSERHKVYKEYAQGVTSRFECLAVLKGEYTLKEFTVRHFKFINKPKKINMENGESATFSIRVSGPNEVNFDIHKDFKEKGESYSNGKRNIMSKPFADFLLYLRINGSHFETVTWAVDSENSCFSLNEKQIRRTVIRQTDETPTDFQEIFKSKKNAQAQSPFLHNNAEEQTRKSANVQ